MGQAQRGPPRESIDFRLPTGSNNTVPLGSPVSLRIQLADGTVIAAKATPAADGEVEVDVPGAR